MDPLTRKRKNTNSNSDDPQPTKRPRAAYALRPRPPSTSSTSSTTPTLLSPPPQSPSIPDLDPPLLRPPVTRDTLRELDLDAILRNPQLRHDLLFDPGLQFRPTSGHRKRIAADNYWDAIARELLHPDTPRRTPPRPPTPPPWSPPHFHAYLSHAAAHHDDHGLPSQPQQSQPQPPRLLPMLHELVAVLNSVIVPPPLAAAPPPASADARILLSHLDPDLIAQELHRGLFDPAGLFALIGATLKRHCAPMRDRLVDDMIRAAAPAPHPDTPTRRTLRTIRLCFEILELMKLDIANHQLQHLRPFLAASTPDFELRTFAEQCRRTAATPHLTRAWLQRAWPATKYMPLQRRARIQLALVHALTQLVFTPAPAAQRPETLYLDATRVTLLERDAADLTALYMLLLLWRQLVYARGAPPRRLDDWEVDRVKREIWEVGPRRIGSCFAEEDGAGDERWAHAMQNVALQIARRAEDARCRDRGGEAQEGTATTTTTTTTARPPAEDALRLMRGWIASHLRRGSALAGRLRELLRQEVVKAVVRLIFGDAAQKAAPEQEKEKEIEKEEKGDKGGEGLEPLAPEIRHLAQRVGKLVVVHMRVYWSLYEARGFLVDDDDGGGPGEGVCRVHAQC